MGKMIDHPTFFLQKQRKNCERKSEEKASDKPLPTHGKKSRNLRRRILLYAAEKESIKIGK